MNRQSALELLKPHLTQSRYDHTVRVTDVAIKLAEHYQVDSSKVELAAIFHDYAKYRDLEEMEQIILQSNLPRDLLHFHTELWHGPVGAILVKQEIGITDLDILSGIHWHTTGKAHMSTFEKIIFIADYIEPGREFPGIHEVRQQAEQDLNKACFLALQNTITFLVKKQQLIYPDTFHAYNYFKRKIRGVI